MMGKSYNSKNLLNNSKSNLFQNNNVNLIILNSPQKIENSIIKCNCIICSENNQGLNFVNVFLFTIVIFLLICWIKEEIV